MDGLMDLALLPPQLGARGRAGRKGGGRTLEHGLRWAWSWMPGGLSSSAPEATWRLTDNCLSTSVTCSCWLAEGRKLAGHWAMGW